jgi:hypothetical protein
MKIEPFSYRNRFGNPNIHFDQIKDIILIQKKDILAL